MPSPCHGVFVPTLLAALGAGTAAYAQAPGSPGPPGNPPVETPSRPVAAPPAPAAEPAPAPAPPPAQPVPTAPPPAEPAAPPPTSVAPPKPEAAPTPEQEGAADEDPEPKPPKPSPRGAPVAGYRNGTFFIRTQDDALRLYIMGRVHTDWVDQLGPGTSSLPPGSNIYDGFFLRRARLELGGEFYERLQWFVGVEAASGLAVSNPSGTQFTPTCLVNSKTGALSCTNNANAVQAPTVRVFPTDAYVNYAALPIANIQVGQYFIPFTLDNRISDNTTPFLEKSMPVRNIGAPTARDVGVMGWGETLDRKFHYAVMLLNGDGPNRVNLDTRYGVAGRIFVRPFATSTKTSTKWTQFGISGRFSSADPRRIGYDMPALTTQEGFAFWKPTYKNSLGQLTHIMPSMGQWAIATDVYVPIANFDFTGEFMYVHDDTREALDGYQLSPFTERLGVFKGFGWYAQASYWIYGGHHIISHPNYGRPPHVDLERPQKPLEQGVQVLAKLEQLHLNYNGSSRGGLSDPLTPNGDITSDDFEVGINYWMSKHLRVTFNYAIYVFPGSAPVSATTTGGPVQTSSQRAVAPAQNLATGLDDSARDSGHTLSELSARVGVQF